MNIKLTTDQERTTIFVVYLVLHFGPVQPHGSFTSVLFIRERFLMRPQAGNWDDACWKRADVSVPF